MITVLTVLAAISLVWGVAALFIAFLIGLSIRLADTIEDGATALAKTIPDHVPAEWLKQ